MCISYILSDKLSSLWRDNLTSHISFQKFVKGSTYNILTVYLTLPMYFFYGLVMTLFKEDKFSILAWYDAVVLFTSRFLVHRNQRLRCYILRNWCWWSTAWNFVIQFLGLCFHAISKFANRCKLFNLWPSSTLPYYLFLFIYE